LRFGVFELNLASGELTRAGRPVDIQEQPLRIIAVLAQRTGELVSREEMRQKVWPDDTFVDFESGLRTALKKARQALGDDAANPRFIETVPRQGFRFIAPVSYVMPSQAAAAEDAPSLQVVPRPEPEPAPLLEPASLPLPAKPSPARLRRGPILAAAALLALAIWVAVWLRTRPHPPVLDHPRLFAAARGNQYRPAFSPNGEFLAFDWKGPQDAHTGIYVQRLTAAAPIRLSGEATEDLCPVWSRDGSQIAFLRNSDPGTLSIFTIPLVGAGERRWADFRRGASLSFDWSGDGKWFAVAEPDAAGHPPAITLISLNTGERRVITSPPDKWRGDSLPVFSPDSAHIAFRRTTPASGHEDLYQIPLTGGQPERLTFDDRTISALVFTPDGGLLFSSKRETTTRSLWWISSHGRSLTHVTAATFESTMPAVSRDGAHFAFSKLLHDVNIWQTAADGSGDAQPLIDSDLPDFGPELSPDGRRIVFQSDRTGTSEIWVSDANGAAPASLTAGHGDELGNPRWSPDGRLIAFEWHPSSKGGIYVMAADGGGLKLLAPDADRNGQPTWSHDGRFLYFTAHRASQPQIWKAPITGGPAIPEGNLSGSVPVESPDGRYLYVFRDGDLWRVPLENGMPSGPESQVLAGLSAGDWGNWVPSDRGIYYVRRRDQGAAIEYIDLASRAVRTAHIMSRPPLYGGRGLALSPDGKTLLFCQIDVDGSNIFVQ
jgi:Tol biopolymer transport system component/DNA-binding winged helix-turn-helix (wHTH) protein